MIKTTSQKTVYTDAWMSLRQDDVIFPNGKAGTHTVIERKHGAFVLIYNNRNEILLVKQYRYPIQNFDWGFPGGGTDDTETFEQGAKREVEEEVGIQLTQIESMGWYYALSPLSTEKIYLYFSQVETIDPKIKGEYDEQISETRIVSIQKAMEMIDTNQITDPFTANALQIFYRRVMSK